MNGHIFIIGGQHGDEPTGIEICRMLMPIKEKGKVLILPCANPIGYEQNTRDNNGVDMNRAYNDLLEDQELGKKIDTIKEACKSASLVIDVHSTFESMLEEPCILLNQYAEEYRGIMDIEEYQSEAPEGSLRWFCDQHKVPMITYEAVEIDPVCEDQVNTGVDQILAVLNEVLD